MSSRDIPQAIRFTATLLKRKRKAESNPIAHTDALDRIARFAGYEGWNAARKLTGHEPTDLLADPDKLIAYFEQMTTALKADVPPVLQHSSKSRVVPVPIPKSHTHTFHKVQIGDMVFTAFATGPHIHVNGAMLMPDGREGSAEGVAIGPGVIFITEDRGAWICKYDPSQECCSLSTLSRAEIETVAREFGLDLDDTVRDRMMLNLFVGSPAFQSLVQWADRHPRLLKDGLESTYEPWARHVYEWREHGDDAFKHDGHIPYGRYL